MTRRAIALVCPYSMSAPGGVQNHVLGLAGYLTARGHRVEVLAPGRVDPGRLAGYGLRPGQLYDAGRTLPVRYNGSVAPVNFGPAALLRVHRWLARGDFDLVHVHEPLTPSVAGWALVTARIPVVATFHTATPRSRTMAVAGRALARTVDKIDAGLAVSGTARQVVVQHLRRDARVIPNGFRRDEFAAGSADPAESAGAAAGGWRRGDQPRIAFLGRLDEPRKGLDVLLRALPRIRAVHPGIEIIVAGQGRRPLPPGVIAPGRIDDPARAELLASVDLFVAPHVARESFGIVLVEAMASGATVVASDLPPFGDLLGGRDGERDRLGYQFAAGDPDALAEAVLVALTDDRRALTRRARRATRRWDWARVGAEIEAVYDRVLDDRPVPGPPTPGSHPRRRRRTDWTDTAPEVVREAQRLLRAAAGRRTGSRRAAELRADGLALLDPASATAGSGTAGGTTVATTAGVTAAIAVRGGAG